MEHVLHASSPVGAGAVFTELLILLTRRVPDCQDGSVYFQDRRTDHAGYRLHSENVGEPSWAKQFGREQKIYKFEKIKRAKRLARKKNIRP